MTIRFDDINLADHKPTEDDTRHPEHAYSTEEMARVFPLMADKFRDRKSVV